MHPYRIRWLWKHRDDRLLLMSRHNDYGKQSKRWPWGSNEEQSRPFIKKAI